MNKPTTGAWVNGLAEWTEGDTAYLSVAFTWRLPDAFTRAIWWRNLGYKVRAGGPGVFTSKGYLDEVAEVGGEIPDAVHRHNPMATIASRGCPVGCWFCIVPKMEGKQFTLLPDFPVRPVLCDNNLSALPADFQDHIIARYQAEGIPLLDANSGFEPKTFDKEVYQRWAAINRGPWRFAYDESGEREDVRRVLHMLRDVRSPLKRVYVLIGNEPVEQCMRRIQEVLEWGGEPHVQPYIKLNALEKNYHVRFDWSRRLLTDVARWANRRIWKYADFAEYAGSLKSRHVDSQQITMPLAKKDPAEAGPVGGKEA